MPQRVEPMSEVVFRGPKPRGRPYLLADGNGIGYSDAPVELSKLRGASQSSR